MTPVDIPKIEKPIDAGKKFFEDKGYENVRRSDRSNVNEIFYATKDGKEFFIKKFSSSKEKNIQRSNNELACYNNLPKEMLIDAVEVNIDHQYLILEKVELQDIEKNEQSIDRIIGLLDEMKKIDASFLPEIGWEEYEELFEKARDLENNGIISGSEQIITLFRQNKKLIENRQKVFSHHDFNLHNIKKLDDRIVIFDFEYAGRDNAMTDAATFYTEIYGDKKLEYHFKEKNNCSADYDEKLFDLMLMRRCIIVLHKYQSRDRSSDFFKKNVSILNEISNKHYVSN